MQKFLRTLMLVALLLPFASQAQTLTVCDGTVNSQYIPFDGYNADAAQHNQMIYPASELTAMSGQAIMQMVFYIDPSANNGSNTAASRLGTWTVSLGETTATTLSALDNTTTLTQVYQGYFDCSTGTLTIEFDQAYLYNGGNLLVDLNHAAASWNRWYFLGVTTTDDVAYNSNDDDSYSFLPKCTFTYGAAPTCFKVSDLAIDATQTTNSSLTLTWADALNTGATYSVYAATPTDTTLVAANITGTTYTVENLDANTEYTFNVVANCSATDASEAEAITGRTACAAMALPFTETFDSTLSTDPCWRGANILYTDSVTVTMGNNSNWTYCSSESNGLAAGHYRVNIFGTTCNKWMITPDIDLSEASNPLLTFNAAFTKYSGTAVADGDIADDKFMILVSTNNGQTWSVASDISLSTLASLTYIPQYVNLANYAGETVRIAFYGESTISGGDNNLHIDNISVDESTGDICYPVSGLAASNVTADGATLTWDGEADSYNVYTIAGNDTTLVDNVTDTFMVIDELTAITSYTYGVRSVCGSDESDMVSITFRTACGALAAPYTWDFEDMNTSAVAICWTKLGGGSANVTSGTTTAQYHSATKYIQFSGVAGNNMLVLPETEDEISALQLRFWTRPESFTSSSCGTFSVGYVTDPTDATTFVAVTTYTYSDFTDYEEKTVTFGGAPTGARMAMRHDANATYYYWRVDDVTIEEAPSCLPVTVVTVTDITAESAIAHWTGTATNYNVYLGTDTDTSLYQTTAGDNLTIDNLDPQTDYVVGVSAICGSDESPITYTTFRTACSAITIDAENLFSESFEGTEFPPACWSTAHTAGSATSVWQRQTTAAEVHTGSASAKLPDMQVGNKANLVTPMFDIDEAYAYQISFWMHRVSSTKPNEGVKVWVNTTPDTIGGTPLMHIRRGFAMGDITEDAAGWYQYSAAIPTSGNVYIIFEGISEYGNYSSIDDIAIEAAPACLPVSGLAASNVTADGATLSWNGNADSYNVYAIAADTTFVQNVTDATIDLTNLTANTQYTYGVTSACGSDESGMVTVSFRTACSSIAIPFTEGFENGIDCWTLTSCASGTNVSTSNPYSGTQAFKFAYNTNPPQYLISPELTGTEDGVVVNFMYRVGGSYQESFALGYSTTTADVTAFTWLTEQTGLTNQTYEPYMQVLPADVKYVAIKYTANDMLSLYIDDFSVTEIPDCAPVTDLAASNVTADSATLTWTGTADSYNVYTIVGDDTTLVDNVTDMFIELGNLTAMTSYTYGVASVCGSDESEMRSVNFTTACAAVTLPYTETFTATSATRNCWTLVSNNTANVGGSNGMDFVTVSGRDVMRFSSYTSASDYNQYGFSPLMNVSTDATNLQVKVVYGTYGTSDQLFFGYITATDTVWDPTPYSTEGGYSASDWQSQTFVIPATATQLAVHYYGNYQYYAWVDSVVVTELTGDYCYPVSALTVDSATTTSISLSWTSDATSFTVLDMADSSVIAANVTTTSYEVTGLTAMTAYTFGVVVNCATGNSDTMTITANTACATTAINLPFNEDFSATSNTRNCWTLIDADNDGLGWTNQIDYTGDAQEYMMSYSYDNATYEALTPDNWMISPKLHSNANSTVTMQWKVASATSYPAEHYGIYVSTTTTDTSAFTMVNEWTISNGSEEVKTIDLSAYAGQDIYVAFRHHNCTDMYVLMIDDVQVYEGAYVPDTLKVTFATADATMGTTDPAPGVYNYIDGDTIFFGSQANNGYIFQKWVIVLGDGAPQELGPQFANGYYIPASNWMSYDSVSFTAYFEPGVPDSVQVTYAVNNATMGTITPAAGTYNVVVGSAVTAQATPNTGYELTAWVLGIYNATGSLINADTLLATDADFSNPVNYGTIPQSYADNNYTITVTALFDVQSTPQPVTEATIAASDIVYWVGSGNNQMVMAVNWANAAYAWGVRFNGSITVQNALDTIATYDPRFNWTTGSYGLGDITFVEGNINLAGDSNSYWESKNNGVIDAGLAQTLANGNFEKWAQPVAGVVTDSTYDSTYNYWWYTYTYPMTITPMWAPQVTPTNLTVTYATNDANLGTTNPAPGTYTYGASDTVFFNAIPTTGNSFVAWIIDYSDGTADTVGAQYQSGYYFLASSMMGDGITSMTFTAYFQAGVPAPDSISVTYTVNDAVMGTITPNGTIRQAVGDSLIATATANDGYRIHGWRLTIMVGEQVASDTTFVTATTSASFGTIPQYFVSYGASVIVTAIFEPGAPDSVAVTYTVNDSTMGSITPNGTVMTAVGDSIAATATANAGYELYGWRFTVYVNGAVVSDTTLAIVETSVNFGAVPQFYANANATVTITAMFQQQVGIEDADISNVNVYSANSTIYVRGAEGQSVYVFDVNGRMLNHEAKASESCSFRMENTGVYLVKVGNAAAQRVIVVR